MGAHETMTTLAETTRAKLMGVSVATLCTALYKRGLRNQTIQDVRPVAAKGRNMVGPAFTLRRRRPRRSGVPPARPRRGRRGRRAWLPPPR